MQSLIQRTKELLTPSSSSTNLTATSTPTSTSSSASTPPPAELNPKPNPNPNPKADPDHDNTSTTQPPQDQKYIFPKVDPASDGPDCLLDCDSCTIAYPRKFSIDEEDELYGHVQGWDRHLVIATGKSDWVRDVADEKGSVMEAVGRWYDQHEGGGGEEDRASRAKKSRCMVSASNMPVPVPVTESDGHSGGEEEGETEVLVLPQWETVQAVKPSRIEQFMEDYVAQTVATTDPVIRNPVTEPVDIAVAKSSSSSSSPSPSPSQTHSGPKPPPLLFPTSSSPPPFSTRPCPHRYVILLCSQKTRDARCGQSAPLLRREFERHLRSLGLYRDLHDERPGGVGIYFISHVGGHKYSANVMVYRRAASSSPSSSPSDARTGQVAPTSASAPKGKADAEADPDQAIQCIWLARVRPEDCEGIIKHTVLKGKLVKPERQLRGGFDRCQGLVSW